MLNGENGYSHFFHSAFEVVRLGAGLGRFVGDLEVSLSVANFRIIGLCLCLFQAAFETAHQNLLGTTDVEARVALAHLPFPCNHFWGMNLFAVGLVS